MRSVITFLVCTGCIVWAHSSDTRVVGLKAYAHKPSKPPVYKKEFLGPDMAGMKPVLFAHYMHAMYLDTINISARRIYPD
jgi:hypothetical protein